MTASGGADRAIDTAIALMRAAEPKDEAAERGPPRGVGEMTMFENDTTERRATNEPPANEEAERAYCERLFESVQAASDAGQYSRGVRLLMRERAAVRAESAAEVRRLSGLPHILELKQRAIDAERELAACEHDLWQERRTIEYLRQQVRDAEAEIERTREDLAAMREARDAYRMTSDTLERERTAERAEVCILRRDVEEWKKRAAQESIRAPRDCPITGGCGPCLYGCKCSYR